VSSVLGVHDLSFSYRPGGELVIADLTHEFTQGRVTAITGPSGRGKSTLLYLLGLLLTPRAGQVLLDGRDIETVNDTERSRLRARRIGFVFQDSELASERTILDGVMEPTIYAGFRRADYLPRARELMTQFGIAHRADHRPGQVSGGQAQRVALCRALITRPDIVLADEPTGNLDQGNASLVLDTLTAAARESGCTVIIATHDPGVLAVADEVVSL